MIIAGQCLLKVSAVNIPLNLQVALKCKANLFTNDLIMPLYKIKTF